MALLLQVLALIWIPIVRLWRMQHVQFRPAPNPPLHLIVSSDLLERAGQTGRNRETMLPVPRKERDRIKILNKGRDKETMNHDNPIRETDNYKEVAASGKQW